MTGKDAQDVTPLASAQADQAQRSVGRLVDGPRQVPPHPVQGMPTVVDLLAETGIVSSKSAARRAIAGGGAYLNNAKVTGEEARPEPSDLLYGRYLVLRHGRRTVAGVEVASD